MNFASGTFFLFLVLLLAVHWLLPWHRARKLLLRSHERPRQGDVVGNVEREHPLLARWLECDPVAHFVPFNCDSLLFSKISYLSISFAFPGDSCFSSGS